MSLNQEVGQEELSRVYEQLSDQSVVEMHAD